MSKRDLISGILFLVVGAAVGYVIGTNFSSMLSNPVDFVFPSICFVGATALGGALLHLYKLDKKKFTNMKEQLFEIYEKFKVDDPASLDEEKIKHKLIEKSELKTIEAQEKYGKFNPYLFVAIWYMGSIRDEIPAPIENADATYKIIMGMKQSGYSNDEIAEYLMMEMAELYGAKKQLESVKADMALTRKKVVE